MQQNHGLEMMINNQRMNSVKNDKQLKEGWHRRKSNNRISTISEEM